MIYDLTYTTLEAVKTRKTITETTDDALIVRLIRAASDAITTNTGVEFVPYYQAKRFDFPFSRQLDLRTPALSVSSVADAGGTILAANYVIEPLNTWPKWTITLKRSSTYWYYDYDPEGAITVTGYWGWNRNANNMWRNVTTLSASINSSVTSVAVASAASIGTLSYIKVDDEYMQVTAISGNTLTVERGVNGTTAAAHDNAAAVALYYVNSDIKEACEELTLFLYNNREMETGGNVQILDSTVLVEQTSPRTILDTLAARYIYVGGISV